MNEALDDREQAIEAECTRLLREMIGLRDFEPPSSNADPSEVHEALRDDLRPRLDRAEVLMREMAGYARQARRTARRLRAEADEVYDTELARLSGRAVTREYESVRDREVLARVKASPKRRSQLAAERVQDLVEESEEAMKSMFFGLRDIRRELLAALEHYFPWKSSLET